MPRIICDPLLCTEAFDTYDRFASTMSPEARARFMLDKMGQWAKDHDCRVVCQPYINELAKLRIDKSHE